MSTETCVDSIRLVEAELVSGVEGGCPNWNDGICSICDTREGSMVIRRVLLLHALTTKKADMSALTLCRV